MNATFYTKYIILSCFCLFFNLYEIHTHIKSTKTQFYEFIIVECTFNSIPPKILNLYNKVSIYLVPNAVYLPPYMPF